MPAQQPLREEGVKVTGEKRAAVTYRRKEGGR
jgi:hypothetical protein